jgi:hypothetical protein
MFSTKEIKNGDSELYFVKISQVLCPPKAHITYDLKYTFGYILVSNNPRENFMNKSCRYS